MRRLLSTEYTYTLDIKKLSRANPSENENKLNDPNKYIYLSINENNSTGEQTSDINSLLDFPEYLAGFTAIVTNIGLLGFKDNADNIISVYDILTIDTFDEEQITPDYFSTIEAYTEANNPISRRIIHIIDGEFQYNAKFNDYVIVDCDALDSDGTLIAHDSNGLFSIKNKSIDRGRILFNYKPAFKFNTDKVVWIVNEDELISASSDGTFIIPASFANSEILFSVAECGTMTLEVY